MKKTLRFASLSVAVLCSACTSNGLVGVTNFGDAARKGGNDSNYNVAALPNGELVDQGQRFYLEKDYGNAQAVFQKAVEIYPRNPEAWLGLAASYDQLRRFDQSSIAYAKVHALAGDTVAYHNNRGFSLLLQGKVQHAARSFRRALSLDPANDTAANNLTMIRQLAAKQQITAPI